MLQHANKNTNSLESLATAPFSRGPAFSRLAFLGAGLAFLGAGLAFLGAGLAFARLA